MRVKRKKKLTIRVMRSRSVPVRKDEGTGSRKLTRCRALAIIIRTGYHEETALHLAERIISPRQEALRFLPHFYSGRVAVD